LWVYLLGRFSLMLYFFPAAYPNIYYRALLNLIKNYQVCHYQEEGK